MCEFIGKEERILVSKCLGFASPQIPRACKLISQSIKDANCLSFRDSPNELFNYNMKIIFTKQARNTTDLHHLNGPIKKNRKAQVNMLNSSRPLWLSPGQVQRNSENEQDKHIVFIFLHGTYIVAVQAIHSVISCLDN